MKNYTLRLKLKGKSYKFKKKNLFFRFFNLYLWNIGIINFSLII